MMHSVVGLLGLSTDELNFMSFRVNAETFPIILLYVATIVVQGCCEISQDFIWWRVWSGEKGCCHWSSTKWKDSERSIKDVLWDLGMSPILLHYFLSFIFLGCLQIHPFRKTCVGMQDCILESYLHLLWYFTVNRTTSFCNCATSCRIIHANAPVPNFAVWTTHKAISTYVPCSIDRCCRQRTTFKWSSRTPSTLSTWSQDWSSWRQISRSTVAYLESGMIYIHLTVSVTAPPTYRCRRRHWPHPFFACLLLLTCC